MARVSVVVPCSNRKEALKATVESILSQSFTDWELIIADDGSTDLTGPLMLAVLGPDSTRAEQVWRDSLHEETGNRSIQMLRNGSSVRYLFHATARGAAAARNRAVAHCSGDLLAFAEAGDVWSTHKLALQVRALDGDPDLHAVIPDMNCSRGAGARKRILLNAVEFEEVLNPPGLPVSGGLLRRACLDWEGPFDENLPSCEEYDFWLRVACRFRIARLAAGLQAHAEVVTPNSWNSDRYRVYSLEKSFQGGQLNPIQRHRVAEMLVDRCARLAQGFRQKENIERSNFYERKRKRFITEVAKLDVSDPHFTGKGGRERRLTSTPV